MRCEANYTFVFVTFQTVIQFPISEAEDLWLQSKTYILRYRIGKM